MSASDRTAAPAPDITVVIPAFRRPAELAEAMESVARQDGVTVEIIVVDDCPDGSAREVAERFAACPVTYLRNPVPSAGRPALVRNLGSRAARGELIHFLDDDDRVPDGYHAAALEVFRSAPGIDVVFGRVEPFGADQASVAVERAYFEAAALRARRCSRLGTRWAFAAAMVFRPTLLVCGAAILRRSRLPDLRGFDGRLLLMEDVDFYARAIRRYGARFIDRPALHYRIGPSLMHGPEGQRSRIAASYRHMQERYRGEHGLLDYLALKFFAHAIGA